MGRLNGKATARSGENGEVEYDMDYQELRSRNQSRPESGPETLIRSMYKTSAMKKAREEALGELLRSEEAAARNTTKALSGGAGNVSGQPEGGSVATTTTQTQATEGNPGMDDHEANSDIDLSTSDTTIRRKAGYRRDSGIRI